MRNILITGSGRSASSLIRYLLSRSESENFRVTIGDVSEKNALRHAGNHPNADVIVLDVTNPDQRKQAVQQSDLVISMLPPALHIEVARDCVEFGKHLVTASYVSKEMEALDEEVKAKGLVFMNEIGLDPGIDHMSAMKIIDRIRSQGGKMLLFESFCGGLVAPESDDNVWNYKFTWNPRNVVLAGQGGAAEFVQEGQFKAIPYHRLFRRTEFINIENFGKFEVYPNRNSLRYQSLYGLENIRTLYRGTIRRVGFSKAWNMFVQLGMTDDTYIIPDSETMSYRDFVNIFLAYSHTDSVELKLRYYLNIDQDDLMWEKLEALDLFSRTKKIGIKNATPAMALQKILEDSWYLKPEDKDMILMYHKFGFELDGIKQQIDSHMVLLGEDQTHTAMALSVGLPAAIAAVKILNGEITTPGVQIPVSAEVYKPVLEELETRNIQFVEKKTEYAGYIPAEKIV